VTQFGADNLLWISVRESSNFRTGCTCSYLDTGPTSVLVVLAPILIQRENPALPVSDEYSDCSGRNQGENRAGVNRVSSSGGHHYFAQPDNGRGLSEYQSPPDLDQSHRVAGIVADDVRQSVDGDCVCVPLRSECVLDALLDRLTVCEYNYTRCRAVSDVLNG
jgi:hypothetical protein